MTEAVAGGLWRRQAAYVLTSMMIVLPLWLAWRQHEYRYITPEQGIGYWLGIIGGVLMLALLLYPLRKRSRRMSGMGTVRQWFIIHQLFGLFGPMLIVLHSNFSLGSLNGRVAFISMLIVAVSGLVGRYFYGRSHYQMRGHQEGLALLRAQENRQWQGMRALLERVPEVDEELKSLAEEAVRPGRRFAEVARAALVTGWRARSVRRRALQMIRRASRSEKGVTIHYREAKREVKRYVNTVIRVAQYHFFERLLSMWHMLHMPLFILLIITATFHVVAVHMY